MAPVFHRLEHEVEEVAGVPTELNRLLARGRARRRARSRRSSTRATPSAYACCPGSASPPRAPSTRSSSSRGCRSAASARSPSRPRAPPPSCSRRCSSPAPRSVPFERGGRREAADRRRGAEERLRGPDAAPRPRPALARAHRAADGLRRLGRARAGRRRRSADLEHALVASVRPRRAPSPSGSPARRACATAIRPASSRATSRSSATASARASAPGSTRSSRWPRDVGELDRRARAALRRHGARALSAMAVDVAEPTRRRGDPREGARRRADRPTTTPSRSCARATSSPSGASPTRCATARATRDQVTFIVDRNINYTNVCVTDCDFCAFYRRPGRHARGLRAAEAGDLQEDRGDARARRHRRAHAGRPPPRPRHRVVRGPLQLDQERATRSTCTALSPPEIQHISRRSKLTICRDALAAARRRARLAPGRRRRGARRSRARRSSRRRRRHSDDGSA